MSEYLVVGRDLLLKYLGRFFVAPYGLVQDCSVTCVCHSRLECLP